MAELYPSDAELNALSGTTDSEQEVLYVTTGESPYYTSFYKMLHRLLKATRRAGDLRVFKDGDLTFGVRAGRYLNGDTEVAYAGATAQALTNNVTNYIYLTAAGVLTVNTTGFGVPSATPQIPLATIVTSAGAYDGRDASEGGDVTDYRGRSILTVCRAPGVENVIADPGAGGAIPVTNSGTLSLVTAAAETRTLAIPPAVGRILNLGFKTDAGDCVITVASPVNQAGNNTLTFADAGDQLSLIAIEKDAALVWRVLSNDGISLSTV